MSTEPRADVYAELAVAVPRCLLWKKMVSSESITFLILLVPCHHCMYNLHWTVNATCYFTSSERLKGQNNSSLLVWPCIYLRWPGGHHQCFFFIWIEKSFKRKNTCATEFYEPAYMFWQQGLTVWQHQALPIASLPPLASAVTCQHLCSHRSGPLAVPVTLIWPAASRSYFTSFVCWNMTIICCQKQVLKKAKVISDKNLIYCQLK